MSSLFSQCFSCCFVVVVVAVVVAVVVVGGLFAVVVAVIVYIFLNILPDEHPPCDWLVGIARFGVQRYRRDSTDGGLGSRVNGLPVEMFWPGSSRGVGAGRRSSSFVFLRSPE